MCVIFYPTVSNQLCKLFLNYKGLLVLPLHKQNSWLSRPVQAMKKAFHSFKKKWQLPGSELLNYILVKLLQFESKISLGIGESVLSMHFSCEAPNHDYWLRRTPERRNFAICQVLFFLENPPGTRSVECLDKTPNIQLPAGPHFSTGALRFSSQIHSFWSLEVRHFDWFVLFFSPLFCFLKA